MATSGAGAGDAASRNKAFHDEFWASCTDFSRYNPGARHRRRLILEALQGLPGDSLLDVGCGDGELLLWLGTQLPQVRTFAGADLSPVTVAENARRLPKMTFAALDIQKEALPSTYDLLVCTEVIEHLDDRASAFRHLAAMMNPGGHLVVTCPTGHVYQTERHFGHTSHPSPEEVRSLASAAGLEVTDVANWGFPLYRAMKWATNVNADWAIKNFASGEYTLGKKAVSLGLWVANFANKKDSSQGCQLVAVLRKPKA
jgi:2-polyprenyl-3-methyl-5-hydroxy-6-metoxy-1,4-benzoquinol methylase